jgi:predicted DNA-binding transcriptional regulator AlpA
MPNTRIRYLHLISSEEAASILGISKKEFFKNIKGKKEIMPYIVLPQLKSTDIKYKYNDVVELKKKIQDGSFSVVPKVEELINIDQVGDMLGVSINTIYLWRSKKMLDLKSYKIGKKLHYKIADVLDYIEKNVVK